MFREIFPLLIGFIFFATIGIAYFVTAKYMVINQQSNL